MYFTVEERRAIIILVTILLLGGVGKSFNVTKKLNSSTESTYPEKVNINTATFSQLVALPFIGEKIASRIITYRNKHGKFHSYEDLKNVKGIGEKTLAVIKKYITLEN